MDLSSAGRRPPTLPALLALTVVWAGGMLSACNEPAVGIPIDDEAAARPQAQPIAPTTASPALEEGKVRVTQDDPRAGRDLGKPATQAELEGAWLPLSELNPKDREGLVAVFNSTPAPCGPCQSESLARCLVSMPPRCENLPSLASRAIRMVQSRATLDEVAASLSYGDLWVPVPELERPSETFGTGAVPVHIWLDPGSASLISVVGSLDSIDLRDTTLTFHFLPTASSPLSLATARAAAAARLQDKLEGFLRGIIVVRNRSGASAQGRPLNEDELSSVAVGLLDQGLDLERWEEDRASGTVRGIIDEDLAVGGQLGVRAAPTWFIDGYRLRGAQSVHALQSVLDRARTDRKHAKQP